jgi:hypothetical protein
MLVALAPAKLLNIDIPCHCSYHSHENDSVLLLTSLAIKMTKTTGGSFLQRPL